eukprot:10888864-Ditylum_brightwellii.AAC.1
MCSCQEVPTDNTDDAVCGFKEILRGNMLINKADNPPDIEEDHLCNCWKSPPCLVYSKFTSSASTSSATQDSTQRGITDNHTSGTGEKKSTLRESGLLQRTNKQLKELKAAAKEQKVAWEEEAKVRAKERVDAEHEISNALELLQNAAKPSLPKEDSLTNEIQQLYAKTTEMENRATEMAEWRVTFNADHKERFKEQDKKIPKQLDTQTKNFDNKMVILATSLQDQLSTNQQSLKQMMHDQKEYL